METNVRGNIVHRSFEPSNRYKFDFTECTSAKGWQQYDTDQDASYFGVWVHAKDRKTLTYAEGDVGVVECPTQESFDAEIRHMAEFYGTPPPAFTAYSPDGARKVEVYDEKALFGRRVEGLEL